MHFAEICSVNPILRKRPQNLKYSSKLFQTKFNARIFGGNLIPVFQKAFRGILQVKRCSVESVVKRYAETEGPLAEGRGGDHVSKKMKKEEIQLFHLLRNSNALKLIVAEMQHQSGRTCHLS
jgi:hypothetical protein